MLRQINRLTLSLLSASVLRKQNKPLVFENPSKLTHDFYENFALNFLVKIVIQKLMFQICCIFKGKWFILFPQKQDAEKQKR